MARKWACLLLTICQQDPAAIHTDTSSIDIASCLAAEPKDCPSNIFHLAHPFGWHLFEKRSELIGALFNRVHPAWDEPGVDRIDTNIPRSKFGSEQCHEMIQAGFAGSVARKVYVA